MSAGLLSFPLPNKQTHTHTHTLEKKRGKRETEQKETQVKAEKEYDNGGERGQGENWTEQDRGMGINKSLNKAGMADDK